MVWRRAEVALRMRPTAHVTVKSAPRKASSKRESRRRRTANKTVNGVCMYTWCGSAYDANQPRVQSVFSLGISLKLVVDRVSVMAKTLERIFCGTRIQLTRI